MKDISGLRFGRLLVTSNFTRERHSGGTLILWECICDCGNKITTATKMLVSGDKKSCGCLQSERGEWTKTHGKSKTPEYRTWRAMLQRCHNETASGYEYYGGKGVTVCERWLDFECFLEDMGSRPPGTSIDRIDCEGDYCLDNCRLATAVQQANNRSDRLSLIPA